jgi:hypothetical protein
VPGQARAGTGFGAITDCIRNGNTEIDIFLRSNMCLWLTPNTAGAIFGLRMFTGDAW